LQTFKIFNNPKKWCKFIMHYARKY
jgi:hypothetical protein